jgi:hypothetical protein
MFLEIIKKKNKPVYLGENPIKCKLKQWKLNRRSDREDSQSEKKMLYIDYQ